MNDCFIKFEIGSHFWLEEQKEDKDNHITNNSFNWFFNSCDGSFTFSGRSAIELAIKDAIENRKVKRAAVPSYCCSSMVQPFFNFDIPISFYDIIFNGEKIEYHINKNEECDLLLIMKYFGAEANHYDEIIFSLKNKGCIVIEDVTHILLNDRNDNYIADYQVASLRKWFPVPSGGILTKKKGKLKYKPNIDSEDYVKTKIEAMKEKYNYMIGKTDDKNYYLQKFAQFETSLPKLDRMLKIDDTSRKILETLDINSHKYKRKENAAILYKRLQNLNEVVFLDNAYETQNNVPLFVPILLSIEKRDKLRRFLIEKGVFCPVHWPEVKGSKVGIRENELSLVCDQRYNSDDMNFVADLIVDWCKKN